MSLYPSGPATDTAPPWFLHSFYDLKRYEWWRWRQEQQAAREVRLPQQIDAFSPLLGIV